MATPHGVATHRLGTAGVRLVSLLQYYTTDSQYHTYSIIVNSVHISVHGSELCKLIGLNDRQLLKTVCIQCILLLQCAVIRQVPGNTAGPWQHDRSLAAKLSALADARPFSSKPHVVPSQINLAFQLAFQLTTNLAFQKWRFTSV